MGKRKNGAKRFSTLREGEDGGVGLDAVLDKGRLAASLGVLLEAVKLEDPRRSVEIGVHMRLIGGKENPIAYR